MKLEILVCTTAERVERIQRMLLPYMENICYLISCQGVGEGLLVPNFDREDVRVVTQQGYGLSRNRNHALTHSCGDVLLIADDDEELVPETVKTIVSDFQDHPEWQLVQYRAEGIGKKYPADYVSSSEMAFTKEVAQKIRFNERFGLGSPCLACGEEAVFVYDASKQGFFLRQSDKVVCRFQATETTGKRFPTDKLVQRSKGAVLRYLHGYWTSRFLCLYEAFGWMRHQGINPFPLIKNMYWGIRYEEQS